MSSNPDRGAPFPQTKWLSWLTLVAGAVMCVVAVLMS
jgi:hypothetical protein